MPLSKVSPRLAIALQVWEGDAQIGKRLTKLICDIEPERRGDIEFIVSARRGTNAFAVNDIAETAKLKFENVRVIQCKDYASGWPNGSNRLWAETMMRILQMREAGKIASDGILTFEADCIPLRPDWLNVLAEEWRTRKPGKLCVGHAHVWDGDPKHEPTHINGNAIFHAEILAKHPIMNGSDASAGWDAYHGNLLLQIGQDSPFICQSYRLKNVTRGQVESFSKHGQTPALYHGLKNGIGIDVVESMMNDGTFFARCRKVQSGEIPE